MLMLNNSYPISLIISDLCSFEMFSLFKKLNNDFIRISGPRLNNWFLTKSLIEL